MNDRLPPGLRHIPNRVQLELANNTARIYGILHERAERDGTKIIDDPSLYNDSTIGQVFQAQLRAYLMGQGRR